ncbi:5-oxoprolinase subunit PxpA [Gaetbulibacter jejuensis]|uniref:5-oxoprolinase subunit PxpA n=1 Tax=Gaetbulibacter jejuensis TaxID=584607 RepID=UPI00300BA698
MMNGYTVDINVDVGEGLGNEARLLPYVSSCNIACGGHAGNEETMVAVAKLAKEFSVKIGAHPSFPDIENFGRKPMEMSCADLYTSVKQQVRGFMNVLRTEHLALHHIKPHGALYNLAMKDEKTASVIIEVIKSIALPVKLYVPYGSVIANLALKEQIPVMYEAFADRNYNEDLSLVSRDKSNAVLNHPEAVFEHVFNMISRQKVKTISGVEVDIKADTFCVHGDSPNVEKILQYLTEKLKELHVKIA